MDLGHEEPAVTTSSASVSSERLNRDADAGETAYQARDVAPTRYSSASDRARFYAKTRRAASGCLLWTAGVSNQGYGKFVLGGKTMPAHRAAWLLEYEGTLSSDQFLLHSKSCESRLCVEVTHLRVGTHEENMADRKAQGRYNTSRGANNPFSKFSDGDIARMRTMISQGVGYPEIAEEFQCTRGYVKLIAEGKARVHPTSVPSQRVLDRLEREAKAEARRGRAAEITEVVHPEDFIEEEEWRRTPYEGYWVSSLGRVRGRNKTILKPYITAFGYAVVHCGKGNPRAVHVLVCEAWYGPPPTAGMHAAHYNRKPLDNRPENLRWATPLENIGQDRRRHGTVPRGENHANAKLTQEKAKAIRNQLPGPRGTINRLAREYGVTKTSITNIRDNLTWRE